MDTDVLCRRCNMVNDIAVMTCPSCGQDLTRMVSKIYRQEVLAARANGDVTANPVDKEQWENRPDDAFMDGNPFDTLKCCEKETICILGSGGFEGKCRVCEEKIRVKLS